MAKRYPCKQWLITWKIFANPCLTTQHKTKNRSKSVYKLQLLNSVCSFRVLCDCVTRLCNAKTASAAANRHRLSTQLNLSSTDPISEQVRTSATVGAAGLALEVPTTIAQDVAVIRSRCTRDTLVFRVVLRSQQLLESLPSSPRVTRL